MKVFLSSGSAIRLGLLAQKTHVLPQTIYMMTNEKCDSACAFCPQSLSKEKLSRVTWHPFELEEVVPALEDVERVCIQATSHPHVYEELISILSSLPPVKISLSITPMTKAQMRNLSRWADRVSINLDCATERLFSEIKRGCLWQEVWQSLVDAVVIFGEYRVYSHLIVGLGETEEEMATCMQNLYDKGMLPSLFAFTPLKHTTLEKREKPPIATYRRMQMARYLIANNLARAEGMRFSEGKLIDYGMDVTRIRENPAIYVTTGCPNCDRPYYTETVRQPYNFPREPTEEEMRRILNEF